MEYRFNAEEWQGLTNEERIRRCRLWAHEARKLAEGATPDLREAYLRIASQWQTLGEDIERDAKGRPIARP